MKGVSSCPDLVKSWLEEREINFSFANKERKRYVTCNSTAALVITKKSYNAYKKLPKHTRVQMIGISPGFLIKNEEWIFVEYEQGLFRPLDCSTKPTETKDPDVQASGDDENTFVGAITGVMETLLGLRISTKLLTVEAVEVPMGLYKGELEPETTFRILPVDGLEEGPEFNCEDLRTTTINWISCSPFWVKESRIGFDFLELLQQKKSRREATFLNELNFCLSEIRKKLKYPYRRAVNVTRVAAAIENVAEVKREEASKAEEENKGENENVEEQPKRLKRKVKKVKRLVEEDSGYDEFDGGGGGEDEGEEEYKEDRDIQNNSPVKKKKVAVTTPVTKKAFFDNFSNIQSLCGVFMKTGDWKSSEGIESDIRKAKELAEKQKYDLQKIITMVRDIIVSLDTAKDMEFSDGIESIEIFMDSIIERQNQNF